MSGAEPEFEQHSPAPIDGQLVIQAGQPEDLLAYAWHSLGYQPSNSLLAVGLAGPRRRAGLVVRADLPPAGQEVELMQDLVKPLHRHADAALAIVATAAALTPPQPAIADVAARELANAGLEVVDVVGVTDSAFRSYSCQDDTCCPPTGHPLSRVWASRVAAEFVLRGSSIVQTEAELLADVRPIETAEPVALRRPISPDQRQYWNDQWRAQLAADQDPEPAWARAFGLALQDPALRDSVLLSAALPPDQPAHLDEATVAAALTHPPDTDRLERCRRVLAAAARHAPAGQRADALASLAWLAWHAGAGVRARLLCDLALADQADHRLGTLVASALRQGAPPGWIAGAN